MINVMEGKGGRESPDFTLTPQYHVLWAPSSFWRRDEGWWWIHDEEWMKISWRWMYFAVLRPPVVFLPKAHFYLKLSFTTLEIKSHCFADLPSPSTLRCPTDNVPYLNLDTRFGLIEYSPLSINKRHVSHELRLKRKSAHNAGHWRAQMTFSQIAYSFSPQAPGGHGHGWCMKIKSYLHTVIRFFRSTATFLLDAFFDVRPIAIAVWTQDASIRWSLNASSREPPTPPFGPKHTLHTHTHTHHSTNCTFPRITDMMLWIIVLPLNTYLQCHSI